MKRTTSRGKLALGLGSLPALVAVPDLLWVETDSVTRAWLASSMAAVGDWDGDGVPDLLIASERTGQDGDSPQGGRAEVRSGEDGSVLLRIEGRTLRSGVDRFGRGAAAVGDLNGDGRGEFLVASNHGSGSVGVFSGLDGTLLARLDEPGQNGPVLIGTSFGDAMCTVGDLVDAQGRAEPDGVADFLIGASSLEESGFPPLPFPGHAYLYSGALPPRLVQTFVGEDLAGNFGTDVVSLGDVDGDGRSDFAISALGYTPAAGRVYVFSGANCVGPGQDRPGEVFELTPVLNGGLFFGYDLANVGDIDGDGRAELAVGAPATSSEHSGFSLSDGAAFVYSFQGGSPPIQIEHLTLPLAPDSDGNPSRFLDGFFGSAIADLPRDPRTGEALLDLDQDGLPDPFLDVDRDGVADYLIAAPRSGVVDQAPRVTPENAGGVFLLRGQTGGAPQLLASIQQGKSEGYAYLPDLIPQQNDDFGRRLVILGQAAGESLLRFAAGSRGDDEAAQNGGSIVALRAPGMFVDEGTLSLQAVDAAAPNPVTRELAIEIGPRFGQFPYIVLGTGGGTAPGLDLRHDAHLPLNDDGILFPDMLHQHTSPAYENTRWLLDAGGRALVRLHAFGPVGGVPHFSAMTTHFSVVVLVPGTMGRVAYVSDPVSIELIP